MRMRKFAITIVVTFTIPISTFAAVVGFRCTKGTAQQCSVMSIQELERQGCTPFKRKPKCTVYSEDRNAVYCDIETEACSDASSDGFQGITCRVGGKVRIRNPNLSATWAIGNWNWVRFFCKE